MKLWEGEGLLSQSGEGEEARAPGRTLGTPRFETKKEEASRRKSWSRRAWRRA